MPIVYIGSVDISIPYCYYYLKLTLTSYFNYMNEDYLINIALQHFDDTLDSDDETRVIALQLVA